MIPLLQRCCCFRLRTGTITIGVLFLIINLYAAVHVSIVLFSLSGIQSKMETQFSGNFSVPQQNMSIGHFMKISHTNGFLTSWFSTNVAAFLFHAIADVCLIVGAVKKVRCLINYWVVVTIAGTLITSVSQIILMIVLQESMNLLVIIVWQIIALAFWSYCLLVVNSYRAELKASQDISTTYSPSEGLQVAELHAINA